MTEQLKVRCANRYPQPYHRVGLEDPTGLYQCFYEANHEGKHRNPNLDEWE